MERDRTVHGINIWITTKNLSKKPQIVEWPTQETPFSRKGVHTM